MTPVRSVDGDVDTDEQFRSYLEEKTEEALKDGVEEEKAYRLERARRAAKRRVDAEEGTTIEKEETTRLRAREAAKQAVAAENNRRAERFSAREFLNRPRPARLVPNVLYRDSLARMWGKPGCGKTFVALDLALRTCLGMRWAGQQIEPGRVFYVMAEGAAINAARTDAWLAHHDVDPERLYETDNLHVYDEAIPLVEGGIIHLLADVTELQPVLIILDTKNAMMVGEENSATDAAEMRRALDAIRRASSACVMLIDHAGYNADHARGSTAVRAAMDSELAVTSTEGEDGGPQEIKVVVDRDKAAETGFTRRFKLTTVGHAAVLTRPQAVQDSLADLVDLDQLDDEPADTATSDWQSAEGLDVPESVASFEGKGQVALPDLARYMSHEAATAWGDPGDVGKSRAEAQKELKERVGLSAASVHRAWSALHMLELITPAEGVKTPTGRHRWTP